MTETDDRVRPFANGTQDADWQRCNCERCTKYSDDAGKCEIDEALLVACWDDGTISPEMARRMGWEDTSPPRYVWKCSEVVWDEKWIAEVEAQETED